MIACERRARQASGLCRAASVLREWGRIDSEFRGGSRALALLRHEPLSRASRPSGTTSIRASCLWRGAEIVSQVAPGYIAKVQADRLIRDAGRHAFVEIWDKDNREVMTVVELLRSFIQETLAPIAIVT